MMRSIKIYMLPFNQSYISNEGIIVIMKHQRQLSFLLFYSIIELEFITNCLMLSTPEIVLLNFNN